MPRYQIERRDELPTLHVVAEGFMEHGEWWVFYGDNVEDWLAVVARDQVHSILGNVPAPSEE